MRILILSDSKWRDSFGHSLLAHELIKLGHHVITCSFDLHQQGVSKFKPHMIVLNHLHGARNRKIAATVKRNGGLVCVQPTEGRPNSDALSSWFFSQKDSRYLDLLLSWGDIGEHPKVKVVGSPRFDIYRQYSQLIDSKQLFLDKYRLDTDKPVVGIATSFPQAKFSYRDGKFNAADWSDLGIDTVIQEQNPQQFSSSEYRKLEQFRLYIGQLVYRYPEYTYILKPHPMEDMHSWERFCDIFGIKLIKQDYIFNLVNASDILIARTGCNTIQDAWMMGKPTLQVDFGDCGPGPSSDASLIGACADSMESILAKFVPAFEVSAKDKTKRNKFLKKYGYSTPDSGATAALRIHEMLNERAPVLASEPDLEELLQFNRELTEFSINTIIPSAESLLTGKSVSVRDVNEWMRRIIACG